MKSILKTKFIHCSLTKLTFLNKLLQQYNQLFKKSDMKFHSNFCISEKGSNYPKKEYIKRQVCCTTFFF